MAEYADMITPKELRTLEIDLEKNIIKLNGDDLKGCRELTIRISPEDSEICVKTLTEPLFLSQTYPRKFSLQTKSKESKQ